MRRELNYENDMRIDEDGLDVECLNQPRLMMLYAEEAAQIRYELDLAKEAVDVVEAKTDAAVRSNPNDFGLEKVTEAAIKGIIILDEKCKEKRMAFLEKKKESDLISSAQRAVEARKKMLELLVQLHQAQYFAGPKVPRDLGKEARKKLEQSMSNDKVKSAMERGRKGEK